MADHTCERCQKVCCSKFSLIQHLKKKTPCIAAHSQRNTSDILNEIAPGSADVSYDCDFCNKHFAQQSSLGRHKLVCKKKDDKFAQLSATVAQLRNELEDIKAQRDQQLETLMQVQPTHDVLASSELETFYQSLMEGLLGAGHKRLSTGVTDITIDGLHAEIKRWTCWSQALGQLDKYQHADAKSELRVYMFGKFGAAAKQTAAGVFWAKGCRVFDLVRTPTHIDVVEMTMDGNRPACRVCIPDADDSEDNSEDDSELL